MRLLTSGLALLPAAMASSLAAEGPSVCVIGAGAAGLVTAKALRSAGLKCTLIDQRSAVGGIWNRDGSRPGCENPVYDSLHTNLPKELMAYLDFPFDHHLPSFVSHSDVQRYLEQYAEVNRLQELLRLRTTVTAVERLEDGSWRVRSRPAMEETAAPAAQAELVEDYSAVVVANGHFAAPVVPKIAGAEEFLAAGGELVHSSLYRSPPAEWRGEDIVVVGSGPSGTDLSLELADFGCHVTLAIRAGPSAWPQVPDSRIKYAEGLTALSADRTVTFADGSRSRPIRAVLLATGYDYFFPFLQAGLVSVYGEGAGAAASATGAAADAPREEKRVGLLYKHLFSMDTPTLSFIGLPFKVVPFPLCEAQAKLVAAVLTGETELPSRTEQAADTAAELESLRASGGRNFHLLGNRQWQYMRELYELRGGPVPLTRLRLLERVNAEVASRRRLLPHTYRQSNYRLHFDELDDVGSGWWTVAHPTHPVHEEDTRLSAAQPGAECEEELAAARQEVAHVAPAERSTG